MSDKTTTTTSPTTDAVSRRDVLKTAAAGAGLLMALPVLTSAARADAPTPPAPPQSAPVWKSAGAAKDFVKGEPKRVVVDDAVIWVTRVDHKTVEAVLARCTHRGCELGWDDQSSHLVCPCHGGTFNADGSCVYGTRRDPSDLLPHLQTLPTRVAKGSVEVNVGGLA